MINRWYRKIYGVVVGRHAGYHTGARYEYLKEKYGRKKK